MRSTAYTYMLQHWPNARAMRFEGDCPHCGHDTLYSAIVPPESVDDTITLRADIEICGYFCPACGWSNAGRRPATNIETADDPADVVYRTPDTWRDTALGTWRDEIESVVDSDDESEST